MRLMLAALAIGLASAPALADCTSKVGRDLPLQPIAGTGLSAGQILTINQEIDSAELDVRALLVVSDCRLVFERYRRDLRRDNIQTLYSVTKSVTATLAGSLLLRGNLASLDVPLASLIKKPSNTSAEDWRKAEQITLRNALGMASGLDTVHNPLGGDTLYQTATDRVFESLKPSLGVPPGTLFRYSDRNAALYGAALEGAAKTGLLGFARETLFRPLDFGSNEWLYRDREGRYPGGWALRLRPMDLAKLGQLYLQGGVWNGQRVMPAGFVETLWTPGPAPNYGLGWWIATEAEYRSVPLRYADGVKGQRLYVYPNHRVVVVVMSSLTGPEERAMAGIVAKGAARAIGAGSAADPESERQLGEFAKAGFHGTTKVAQEDQDIPGR